MVTRETVALACSEVSQFTEDQLATEFDRFFRSQPAVCYFVAEATRESGPDIQEISLFLSYMIFKTVETSGSETVEVSPEAVETAFHEAESWIERLNGIADTDTDFTSAVISTLESDAEPYLTEYVISELNQPLEDVPELADEDKGQVFFVLRTVITAFARNRP